MKLKFKLLIVFIGLTFSNFVCQWLKIEPDFLKAFEISYFQGVAFLVYLFAEEFGFLNKELEK